MQTAEIVAQYDLLVARALQVVEDAPFFKSVFEGRFARLVVKGDVAHLSFPDLDRDRDFDYIEPHRTPEFPVHLLTMPEPVFKAWKAAQQKDYEDRERKRKEDEVRRAAADQEARERAMLAALKRKYGA